MTLRRTPQDVEREQQAENARLVELIDLDIAAGRVRRDFTDIPPDGVARLVTRWCLEQSSITLSATDAMVLCRAILAYGEQATGGRE